MDLESKVIELIEANTEKEYSVSLESDLQNDLGVDSFGTIMIVNAIEDAFDIVVEETDIPAMAKVSDIVSLLQTKYLSPPKEQS